MDSNSEFMKEKNLKEFSSFSIQPTDKKILEHDFENNWDFFWSNERMMSSKEMDIIADKMKINRLPEILYGNNFFYLVNSKFNFLLEISPITMLDMSSYSLRKEKLINSENSIELHSNEDLNFIYYVPGEVKVQYHNKWKDVKIDREDVKKVDPTEDWTYSSTYMGTISQLDQHNIFDSLSEQLKIPYDPFNKSSKFEIKRTDMKLPLERLGPNNPIKKYVELNFFDDELNDNGVSMGNFR